jgi:hypothetical protein
MAASFVIERYLRNGQGFVVSFDKSTRRIGHLKGKQITYQHKDFVGLDSIIELVLNKHNLVTKSYQISRNFLPISLDFCYLGPNHVV